MPFVAIVLALAVALGGSASFAAKDTHPGDSLYPIKAHVNDKVEAVLDTVLGIDVNVDADAHTDANVDASATTSAAGTVETGSGGAQHMDAAGQVQVQTGTSVRGGVGGIKTDSQTGVQVGI